MLEGLAGAVSRQLGLAALDLPIVILARLVWVFSPAACPNSPRPRRRTHEFAPRQPADLRRQLVGSARRCFAGRGPGSADELSRAQPDRAHYVRRDPGHARRPGSDPAGRPCAGPAGTGSSRTATRPLRRVPLPTAAGLDEIGGRASDGRRTSRSSIGSRQDSRTGREHLATEDTRRRLSARQERVEHEQIQRGVITAQRNAVSSSATAARSTT